MSNGAQLAAPLQSTGPAVAFLANGRITVAVEKGGSVWLARSLLWSSVQKEFWRARCAKSHDPNADAFRIGEQLGDGPWVDVTDVTILGYKRSIAVLQEVLDVLTK